MMPVDSETTPVGDTVAKINNELAIGSDPDFQRRWATFERIAWIILVVFVLMSLLGVFGRGPLAHARQKSNDGSMEIKYDRVGRFGTPSIFTVEFAPFVVQHGTVQLWASASFILPLGTQRVIPQPLQSQIVNNGTLYTFPAGPGPISVNFAMEPAALGRNEVELQVMGHPKTKINIFVMP